MSLRRRRWSNELLNSLVEFQSREASAITNSTDDNKTEAFVDSLEDKCTNITSMLATLNLQKSPRMSDVLNESMNEISSGSSLKESVKDRLSNNVLNQNINEEGNISKEKPNEIPPVYDVLNTSLIEDTSAKSYSNNTPTQLDHLFNFNERLMENVTVSSDSETLKLSLCNSSTQNNVEMRSIKSQSEHSERSKNACSLSCFSLNERISENIVSISSDSGTIKVSSCNSSVENIIERPSTESHLNKNLIEVPEEGFLNIEGGMIAEMDEPDVWDALLALDEALSPFEERAQTPEENIQNPPQILNRLSQKFRKTPTRFTEKLVSIIEDSIVSLESPTKQYTGDTSGISLHRMTGEFRKLCKFIEDESMPEWAPSLMNITSLEKPTTPEYKEKNKNIDTKTPKSMFRHIIETSTQNITPVRAFKTFTTPKNQIRSKSNTPIKRFTPSADKSFEYWETVCNMMCENQNNKTKVKNVIHNPESPIVKMNEILSICERQMASLDDSTVDIRSSEPCKKTDSELKLKVVQTPRSKSVSNMYSNTSEKIKHSSSKKNPESVKKQKNSIINKKELFGNNFKSLENKELNLNEKEDSAQNFITKTEILKLNEEESFEIDFQVLQNSDSKTNEEKVFDNDFNLLKINDSVKNKKENLSSDFDILNKNLHKEESSDDKFKFLKYRDLSKNKENSFEGDFEPLPCSPSDKPYRNSTENMYDPNEKDCSLLKELAKRRQRCLDTAKLMMEIEREDPISNADTTCLETLYKLGIQDKTVAEIKDDAKFLNTLNECFEYKNYFKTQSKPIMNMLQKVSSPSDLKTKSKNSSTIKSKKSTNQLKPANTNLKTQASSLKKLNLERKNSQDKKMTPRIISNTISRVSSQKLERKLSYTSEIQKMKITPRTVPKSAPKVTSEVVKKTLQPQSLQKKISLKSASKPPGKALEGPVALPKKISSKSTPKVQAKSNVSSTQKRIIPKASSKPFTPKIVITPEGTDIKEIEESPQVRENVPVNLPKMKLFCTPGKSPNPSELGRKKPTKYFPDLALKTGTPQKLAFDSVRSPLSLYINGTDMCLIQNVHGHINDRLLTPVSSKEVGKNPQLKLKLSPKANKTPDLPSKENIVLPVVRYESAKKVRLIDNKSTYSPSSITPNSKTKKLLESIENTVVVRHEGRVIDYTQHSGCINSEMSIRVQTVAEKANSMKKKFM